MKVFDYIRGFFGREPEPVRLALPRPPMTEGQYWAARVAEADARLKRLREEGAEQAELDQARWDREVADENLRAVHQEQAEEWRGADA